MKEYYQTIDVLDELDIGYQIVDHPPALTTEEADQFIEGIPGVRTKTMFLTNKKKTAYFLVIMDDQKHLDMARFKEMIQANKVRMASPESLQEKMSITPGVVSPFGLLFNQNKDIQVYVDQAIINEERMSFHPNTNEKTIFIATDDLFKFLKSIGFDYQILAL